MHQVLANIQDQLTFLRRHYAQLIFADVTATSPFTITTDGGTTTWSSVKKLAAYSSPQVNDRVAAIKAGNSILVLGKID